MYCKWFRGGFFFSHQRESSPWAFENYVQNVIGKTGGGCGTERNRALMRRWEWRGGDRWRRGLWKSLLRSVTSHDYNNATALQHIHHHIPLPVLLKNFIFNNQKHVGLQKMHRCRVGAEISLDRCLSEVLSSPWGCQKTTVRDSYNPLKTTFFFHFTLCFLCKLYK